MLRNYFLINLILFIILGFLGFKLYESITYRPGMPSPSKKKVEREAKVPRRPEPPLNIASYSVISEKDLFRPSRSPAEKKIEVKEEVSAPKNPPKLFGTIILNNQKNAILQDSESNSSKMYKLNDKISGYTITDILEDRVELERNGETFIVKLREDKGITSPRPVSVQQSPAKVEPSKSQPRTRQRRPRRVRRNVPPPPTSR